MQQELGVWMLPANVIDSLGTDARMDVAFAHPNVHRSTGDPLEMCSEKHVRAEEDFSILWNASDDCFCIAARTTVVRLGLDLSTRVDIRHDDRVRILAFPRTQLVGSDRRCK